MPYNPPPGDSVNFVFQGDYIPPSGDGVDFYFGLVASISIDGISRDTVYSGINGFNVTKIRWYSDIPGEYRVELGGSSPYEGKLLDTGYIAANHTVENLLYDSDIITWSGYTGEGSYQIKVYVRSDDNIWNNE
jgi:hypothetical protein